MRPPTWKDEYDERFLPTTDDLAKIKHFIQKDFIVALLEEQKQNIITLIDDEFEGFRLEDWSGECEVISEIDRLKQAILLKLNKPQ